MKTITTSVRFVAPLLFAIGTFACFTTAGCAAAQDTGDDVVEDESAVTAKSNDPFDPRACTGAELSTSDIAKYLPAGGTHGVAGKYYVATRRRTCTNVSGCSAWQAGAHEVLSEQISDPAIPMTGGNVYAEVYSTNYRLPPVVLNLFDPEGKPWFHVAPPAKDLDLGYFVEPGYISAKWACDSSDMRSCEVFKLSTPNRGSFFEVGEVIRSGKKCVVFSLTGSKQPTSLVEDQFEARFLVRLK
ncbi:hypothetical protein AKJ09_06272 [Labilithrix luteola]|uniref:Lipoprotein n=1 Tax=Labilithrix luteola TaxID=1391654 RepID=A0A0K1Q1F3_9BACT|nr:hypothetical protein [Labilithrix luteola]AKU99608.1 hypothetical protein AKJ09_06272 [Labilithrix luteola]